MHVEWRTPVGAPISELLALPSEGSLGSFVRVSAPALPLLMVVPRRIDLAVREIEIAALREMDTPALRKDNEIDI